MGYRARDREAVRESDEVGGVEAIRGESLSHMDEWPEGSRGREAGDAVWESRRSTKRETRKEIRSLGLYMV